MLLAGVLWSGLAHSGALFEPSRGAVALERHLELEADRFAVPGRYRLARIDRSAFARSVDDGAPIVLNLFNDFELRAKVERIKALDSGSSFVSGALVDGGHFSLLMHESGVIRGEIHSARGLYTLKSEGEDFDDVLIAKRDFSGVSLCGAEHPPNAAGIVSHARDLNHQGVSASTPYLRVKSAMVGADDEDPIEDNPIDVLIVYTQRVEDFEGGPDQISAVIEYRIVRMNQALENSGLPHREIRLAAAKKVDYEQTQEHLSHDTQLLIRKGEDNYGDNDFSPLDEVHDLREEHQADLVHLFVRDSAGGVCGISDSYSLYRENSIKENLCKGSSNPETCLIRERKRDWITYRSFSVSSIKCLSFAHELGHNLGLVHTRSGNDYDEDVFKPYAFGYINPDLPSSSGLCQGTIMNIERNCRVNHRVNYFSNPDIFFPRPPDGNYNLSQFKDDTPMGVHGEEHTSDLDGPVNAARAIDEAWDIVAGLFGEDIFAPCYEGDIPANALSGGVSSVEMAGAGGTRDLIYAFPVPGNCAGALPRATSSSPFVTTSVEKLREGEFRVSLTASANIASCEGRSAEVTVELQGAEGVTPATIAVAQDDSANVFCGSIASLPPESKVLDLSRQNRSSLFSLFDGMFSKFTQLEHLNLSDNKLDSIAWQDLEGMELLKHLDLSFNELEEIPERAFEGNLALESLDLSRNKLRSFDSDIFQRLSDGRTYKLEVLDLSHNEIESIGGWMGRSSPFHRLSYLHTAKLKNNKISQLNQFALYNQRVKRLDLSHNEIERIHPEALPLADSGFSSSMTHLWLNSNRLGSVEELPEGVFSHLPELLMLNLARNQISELPDLSNSTKLEALWLEGNRIGSLPSDTFSEHSELRLLNLGGNALRHLPGSLLRENAQLDKLYLSGNELASVPAALLSRLSELTDLSLSGNRLTEIPNLSDVSSLERLWLQNNEIEAVAGDDLSGLSSLTGLDLSGNQISVIEAGAFSDLSQVTHLRLNDNGITSASPSLFDGLSSVTFLTLSGNDITNLPNRAFSRMPKLKSLWLHSNRIRSISPNAFAGLPSLEYLNLAHNPLDGPLPEEVCEFISGVERVHMNGIDRRTVCPQ